ncbi:hypothetical protein IC220_02330 [Wolbachia endosymbiont of Pentalonia nigronervosa]|uniref:hypothetical protein n=1 Tax=Wolbachia endosymbiont of Pentalonia nigronervosa TaxID=1301914 RepID=UPI00165F2D1B|nr:hypothetical protein [Wolbachia endosymbiont of Pentalonia nigronervosa]MBD0391296.1 hypothetical protein [Wolbachia endosymbiont of Pentalonia nigronervosa]
MFSDIDPINVDFTSTDFSESLGMDSFSSYEAAADGNTTLIFMPPNNNYRYYSNR